MPAIQGNLPNVSLIKINKIKIYFVFKSLLAVIVDVLFARLATCSGGDTSQGESVWAGCV